MGNDDNFTEPPLGEDAMPAATPDEIVADEIGDVALEDPERAAQLVSAVTTKETGTVDPRPATPAEAGGVTGGSMAQRAVPAAIVGVFLIQVLPKGRWKRLALAVLGSALVAGLVSGKEQRPLSPPGR